MDKIFGPGHLFVTLAKRQVYGVVGIDGLAGPTETVIIADEGANPAWVAADLLAQAEHDVLAAAILLTPSERLAQAVQAEVSRRLSDLPRSAVLAQSLANRSGIVVTRDLFEAVELANSFSPEHLCLSLADPWLWSERVHAAGGVFLGEWSFEVLGDYNAGPSHVMPTNGTARFASPLNVWDFVHIHSISPTIVLLFSSIILTVFYIVSNDIISHNPYSIITSHINVDSCNRRKEFLLTRFHETLLYIFPP